MLDVQDRCASRVHGGFDCFPFTALSYLKFLPWTVTAKGMRKRDEWMELQILPGFLLQLLAYLNPPLVGKFIGALRFPKYPIKMDKAMRLKMSKASSLLKF